MACCNNQFRTDLDYVRNMAIKTAIIDNRNQQIYVQSIRGVGKKVYDYEPEGWQDRGVGLVEIIRFQDHKSGDLLSDSVGISGTDEVPEELARKKPKSRRAIKRVKPIDGAILGNDEPLADKPELESESGSEDSSVDEHTGDVLQVSE